MNYKFYIPPKSEKRVPFDIKIRETRRFNGDEILETMDCWDGRPKYYYIWRSIGYNKFFDGDRSVTFICLGKQVAKVIKQLKQLPHIYDWDDLLREMSNYPHIVHIIFLYSFFNDNTTSSRIYMNQFGGFVPLHKKDYFSKNIGLDKFYDDFMEKDKFFLSTNMLYGPNSIEIGLGCLNTLIKYADNLIYELNHFKIDLKKLSYSKYYLERRDNIIFSPKIDAIIKKLGVFTAKAFAKSYLGNANFIADFDIPDFESADSDLDFVDLGYIDYNEEFSNLEIFSDNNNFDNYNVSFGAQSATIDRSGGGLGSLDVTITKEPGTSNQFCITDKFGHVIHNVSGTANKIRINGIWYKLPDLKG